MQFHQQFGENNKAGISIFTPLTECGHSHVIITPNPLVRKEGEAAKGATEDGTGKTRSGEVQTRSPRRILDGLPDISGKNLVACDRRARGYDPKRFVA